MYMILIGGGNVGLQLAKRLIARDHEVLLLEKDGRIAHHLSQLIGDEHVMHGDGCEVTTQKSAGFGRADVIVAVTGEDEDNLVVCQMAKLIWEVDRVLARVNDPGHEAIFKEIGIDETVSATGVIFSLLEQQIAVDDMIPIGALAKGNIEVIETVISSRSPVVGRLVRELTLPPQTNFVYIIRNGEGVMVDGDTRLEVDDSLVALVPTRHAQDLKDLLFSNRT